MRIKKLLPVAMAIVMVLALAGCKKEADKNDNKITETPAATEAVKANEAPVATEAVTPEITEEPAPTEAPKAVKPAPGPITGSEEYYEPYIGVWYLYSNEIEGYTEYAAETNRYEALCFDIDGTMGIASANYEYEDEPTEKYDIALSWTEGEDNWWGDIYAEMGFVDAYYYYSFDDDGNLVEKCDIYYDDGAVESCSYSVYVREQQVFPPEPMIIPDSIQAIMDGAEANQWVTVIANPSAELSAELDAAGFELKDESDNEWLDWPMTIPKELVVCNSGTEELFIEIHEPASTFDPETMEGWVPGPFMYFADIKPGELARFIVHMPAEAKDAKEALYMNFGEDSAETYAYYIRIYEYSDNYLNFN